MGCSNARPIFADSPSSLDGIDLARKVKMRGPLLPVILASGQRFEWYDFEKGS
jgi:hypothetical protein